MTVFYGRDTELRHLNSLYETGSFQFTVIYGRRRIGKTSLILKYIEGKNAIYFMALESGGDLNLEGMSRVVHRFLGILITYLLIATMKTCFLTWQAMPKTIH